MKKCIAGLLLIALILSLAACGGGSSTPIFDRTLDFKSILDTESGAVLSLGDPRAYFTEALGAGEEVFVQEVYEVGTWESVEYALGDLLVEFQNDIAVRMVVHSAESQFQFLAMSFDMSLLLISESFETFFPGVFYIRHYDAAGNVVPDVLANDLPYEYTASVVIMEGVVGALVLDWTAMMNAELG